jgi:hypothetical protein
MGDGHHGCLKLCYAPVEVKGVCASALLVEGRMFGWFNRKVNGKLGRDYEIFTGDGRSVCLSLKLHSGCAADDLLDNIDILLIYSSTALWQKPIHET